MDMEDSEHVPIAALQNCHSQPTRYKHYDSMDMEDSVIEPTATLLNGP